MSGWTCRQLLLLIVAAHGVSSQFFGIPQMATTTQVANSNSTSGSVQGSSASDGSSSAVSANSDDSGSNGGSEGSASEASGDDSGSGSWIMGSGSGSSSLEYGCDCRSVRRASLMGASDYCLAPEAPLSSKCGNVDLGESGACPMTGAQPCSPIGHVLANDSLCALDDKDETYKCVASKNDLDIQKHGKKKKKKSKRYHGSGSSSMSVASSELKLTARQVVAIVISLAAGVMAVV